LTFRSFWRQHFAYGSGALYFQHITRASQRRALHSGATSFYLNLLRRPFAEERGRRACTLSVLLAVTQIANAAGFFWTKLKGTPDVCRSVTHVQSFRRHKLTAERPRQSLASREGPQLERSLGNLEPIKVSRLLKNAQSPLQTSYLFEYETRENGSWIPFYIGTGGSSSSQLQQITIVMTDLGANSPDVEVKRILVQSKLPCHDSSRNSLRPADASAMILL